MILAADLVSQQRALLADASLRHRAGDAAGALPLYRKALLLDPGEQDALHMIGVVLAQQGVLEAALPLMRRAATVAPAQWQVYESLSIACGSSGREAESLLASERAVVFACGASRPYLRRGKAMQQLMPRGAARSTLDRAVLLDPASAETRVERGNLHYRLGCNEKALDDYLHAVVLWPDRLVGYLNTGVVLGDVRRFVDALWFLDRATVVDPAAEDLAVTRLQLRMYVCDWSGWPAELDRVIVDVKAGRQLEPFPLLGFIDEPALQLQAARARVRARGLDSPRQPFSPRRAADGRIRIGYYSADFHDHATTYLMAELIEAHDRSRFEVFGFSFGPTATDAMRSRMMAAFDHFIEVGQWSDVSIAAYSREASVDIAVDLKGYTRGSRPAIFALGCAPLQVSYLGYPGTTALPAIDYVIADKVVIPEEERAFFTEHPVYLPGCYQVNDSRRLLPVLESRRDEVGLGGAAFVFCCFNTLYKIHPETFAGWMRVLSAVPRSVLWLIEENTAASDNLRSAAVRAGVDADRLVFAPRLPYAQHLARLGHADLFIDTFPYTAHTTASDALWSGVPVLTRRGRSFASRVAASLLSALELRELITSSPRQFEELAIELALSPVRLAQLRQRLDIERRTSALFDGKRFCRNLERAFDLMIQRHRQGAVPSVIDLTAR